MVTEITTDIIGARFSAENLFTGRHKYELVHSSLGAALNMKRVEDLILKVIIFIYIKLDVSVCIRFIEPKTTEAFLRGFLQMWRVVRRRIISVEIHLLLILPFRKI